MKFEGTWDELEEAELFPTTIIDEILERNSSFHVKQSTTEEVQFPLCKSFC